MKVLKNAVLGLILSLGLVQSQANAGLLVGAIAGNAAVGAAAGGAIAVGVGVAGGLMTDEFGVMVWSTIIMLPGVLLDQSFDTQSSLSQIENAIHQSLPMIEDQEVVRDIAKKAQKKLVTGGTELQVGEKRVITFSDSEIEALTDSLVLSGAEQEEIKRVLQ